MLWAFFLLKNRIKNYKNMNMVRFYGLAALFIGSGLITTLLYNDDNFNTNFLMIYHAAICFFLLYGMHSDTSKNKLKEEMFSLFRTIAVLTTIFSTVGLLVLFIFVRIRAFSYVIGLYGKRFTGLYTHPNIAAFTSVIGIVCCHLMYRRSRCSLHKKQSAAFPVYCFCFAVNFITILLSDSNAAMVFLLVYSAVLLFFRLINKKGQVSPVGLFKLGFTCIFLLAGFLALRSASQTGMAAFVNSIHAPAGTQQNLASTSEENHTDIESVEIGREERADLSSGRLDSWEKGLTLFQMKPLLGIGKGNILEYGERYLTQGFLFFDLHNGYLTILVSCGLIGFAFFIGFILCVAHKVLKFIFSYTEKNKEDHSILPLICASLCGYAIYAFFERALLFDNTFMVAIFWVMLGYSMTIVTSYEKDPAAIKLSLRYPKVLVRL